MSEVVLAVAAYEGAEHLHEALESLLSQSDRAQVLVVDDASRDSTEQVVRDLQASEPRLHYVRHRERIGMVANWRFAFIEARRRWPDVDYFAWASDHDVWHPRWLSSLQAALRAAPDAVLAYPLNIRISDTGGELRPPTERRNGRFVPKSPWRFETAGELRPELRLMRAAEGMSAGNMVYGLWRARALERVGVFHPVLEPDRLVITQAALLGQFVQVGEILWYRRFRVAVDSARQRRALFAGRPHPLGLLPWWLSHALVIAWRFGVRGVGRPFVARRVGGALAGRYMLASTRYYARRWRRKRRRRADKRRSRVSKAVRGKLSGSRAEAGLGDGQSVVRWWPRASAMKLSAVLGRGAADRSSRRDDPRGHLDARLKRIERTQKDLLDAFEAVKRSLGGYGVKGSLHHIELALESVMRGLYLPDAHLEPPFSFTARRFRVVSQNDEDGMTLALFDAIGTGSRRFVEIGCGWNGGNSGFFAAELGWSGLMFDGEEERIASVRRKYSSTRVTARAAFITAENVNELISEGGLQGDVDLLSIDIDGNDLWVWEAIDVVSPRVVICEYNSAFGAERTVTIPYQPEFSRRGGPRFYYGASLRALTYSGARRGYRLVGVEPRGVNAYFVRDDVAPDAVPAADPDDVFRFLDKHQRFLEQGMDVFAMLEQAGASLIEIPAP